MFLKFNFTFTFKIIENLKLITSISSLNVKTEEEGKPNKNENYKSN